jgi:ubiquinone/menaquinone biosynthesis C-methylase UbiE
MPDLYATITQADQATLERLVNALEVRAAQPQYQAMVASYLAEIAFPHDARVLEIGCGTGAISRVLGVQPNVAEVMGVDPSPYFVEKARELGAGVPGLSFEEADGRSLPFEERSFDVVVIHTVLSHVPGPEEVLAEAHRVLRVGGRLAVFEVDYPSITVATGDGDPLQACLEANRAAMLTDRWLVRRLVSLVRAAGFGVQSFRGHGYVETELGYIMTLIDRGADFLATSGRIDDDLTSALKAEARRRVEKGTFFGYIAYTSLIAHKQG